MYGIATYGSGTYGSAEDVVAPIDSVYASVEISLTASFSATSVLGVTAVIATTVAPVVNIGSDQTQRDCVASLQLPLVVSVTSSQPQAVWAPIVAPVVFSALSAVRTTGTVAISVTTPTVSATGVGAHLATAAIVVPVTTAITLQVCAQGTAAVSVRPVVSITGGQPPFAFGGVSTKVSLSASAVAGRAASGAIKAIFTVSGTGKVGPGASSASTVRPTVSASGLVGTALTGAAHITPSLAATSIFYRRIDGTVAFYPLVEFRSKAMFGAVLDDPDLVFIRTKSQPIYVRT